MRRRDALRVIAAAGVACPLRASAQPAGRTFHVALFLAGIEGAVARQRAAIVGASPCEDSSKAATFV